MFKRWILLVLVVLGVGFSFSTTSSSGDPALDALFIIDTFSQDGSWEGSGSAFIAEINGHKKIITAWHVIHNLANGRPEDIMRLRKSAKAHEVLAELTSADIEYACKQLDCAVLRLPESLSHSPALKLGTWYPHEHLTTYGMIGISADSVDKTLFITNVKGTNWIITNEVVNIAFMMLNYRQLAARWQRAVISYNLVRPGHSGGPALNAKGEVVGIMIGLIAGRYQLGVLAPAEDMLAEMRGEMRTAQSTPAKMGYSQACLPKLSNEPIACSSP